MGCCSSLLHRPIHDNGDESMANLLDNENDGDGDGNAEEEAEGEELELIASPSEICRSAPCLFMSALYRWPWYAFNIWDDWVFTKLVGRDGEHRFYALNIEANMSLTFPYLKKDGPVEGSAMAMVGRKLYVIGGVLRDGVVSNRAYECDLHCNAAAAGRDSNLLITCYVEVRRSRSGTDQGVEEAVYSVRAYNPAARSWLTIRGLPEIIEENAERCQFMSLYRRRQRGKQGIGIMLDTGLTISTFDLKNGTPNVDGEITYLEARTDLRTPRPPITKKWLLQT
ncbi:hypothetical protein KI387_003564, partial [Taxus chinensis]